MAYYHQRTEGGILQVESRSRMSFSKCVTNSWEYASEPEKLAGDISLRLVQ